MPYGGYRTPHPQAKTVLILGILTFVLCGIFTAVPAWVIGARVTREIAEQPHVYSGESEAKAGMWMGIIGTCLNVVGLGLAILFALIGATLD
jgi:hypothetical protein